MTGNYIERRETGLYIVGSRVPIDRIVWEYHNGEDAQTIQSHYPTLSLDQVEGVIAFYLSHRDEVEQAMDERKRAEEAYIAAHPAPHALKSLLDFRSRQMASRRT
jgi:uncharacterized protein (DUF433 family)